MGLNENDQQFFDLFDIKELNKLRPGKGRILISEPFLEDPHFKRAVVLLCEHNEEGSFGFVLNKFIDVEVHEFIEDISTADLNTRVSLGGPVKNDALFYIHTLGEALEGSVKIMDGLYMGGDFETLKTLLNTGQLSENSIRFFVGYSGWVTGQLEKEMEQNAWLVSRLSVDDVMNTDEDNLWNKALEKMGRKHAVLANFPEDPSLN